MHILSNYVLLVRYKLLTAVPMNFPVSYWDNSDIGTNQIDSAFFPAPRGIDLLLRTNC